MAKEKKETKRLKFVLSPTAVFGLGYNAGDVAELPEEQAKELVEAFYAVYVNEKGEIEGGAAVSDDVKALKSENAELKKTLQAKDAEISDLKTELGKALGATAGTEEK